MRTGSRSLVEGERIVAVDDAGRAPARARRTPTIVDCARRRADARLRRLAHPRRCSAVRDTRSRRCARRATTTWRSRAGAAASTPRCATCALAREDELARAREAATRAARGQRVTTVEVKSGYGLSLDDELKTLRVDRAAARGAADARRRDVLGAHEIPLEYRDRAGGREEYIALLIGGDDSGGRAGAAGEFADVFCETGVYSAAEVRAHPHGGTGARARVEAARRRAHRCRRRRAGCRDRRHVGGSPRGGLRGGDAGARRQAPRWRRSCRGR